MSTKAGQDGYSTNQASHHKNEEVFNSDDNDGAKDDHGYHPNSYDQFLSSIKSGNLNLFKNILNVHPEYSLRVEQFSGQTPIFEIVQTSSETTAIEMLKIIKTKDADLAYKDKLKQNITFYVARDGKLKLLEFVISEGCNVTEVDSHGQTPLYYAAREGHIKMIKRLIELGVDPNHCDIVRQTCLFYAAKAGLLETCKFLIENGAKHDITDKKKQTALFWAKKSGNNDLVEYMENLKNVRLVQPPAPIQQQQQQHHQPQKPLIPSTSESKSNKKKKSKEEQRYVYNLLYTDENGQKVRMTKDDFQKFIQDHPHLAEYFNDPDKIPTEGLEGRDGSWDKAAKKVVQGLWKLRGAYHFHVPVDPIKFNCPDYFDIVKNPMDFGTIKSRLNANTYETCSQFFHDMKLVFSNCVMYNGKESEIGQIALNLEKEFDRLCHENHIDQFIQDENRSEIKEEESENRDEGVEGSEFPEHNEGQEDEQEQDNEDYQNENERMDEELIKNNDENENRGMVEESFIPSEEQDKIQDENEENAAKDEEKDTKILSEHEKSAPQEKDVQEFTENQEADNHSTSGPAVGQDKEVVENEDKTEIEPEIVQADEQPHESVEQKVQAETEAEMQYQSEVIKPEDEEQETEEPNIDAGEAETTEQKDDIKNSENKVKGQDLVPEYDEDEESNKDDK